jgi:hypothetical protein
LSGSATDSGSGGSGISSVTVNGAAATGGTATGSIAANWSRNVSLVMGANTITVEARDGANNLSASQITINRAVAPVTGVTLTSTLPSPRPTGTAITLTASGSGGVAPIEYKYLIQQENGAPQVVRNWSSTATYTWTPTIAANYTVSVWARSAGVTTDTAQASAQIAYVITAPLSVTSLTSNIPSPQIAGTSINFSATATGGTSPYQFKWWVQSGGVWTVARDWSTTPSLTWQPTTAGTYMVAVWARNAGVTSDASQALAQVNYTINAVTPLSIVSLTSSVASPQTAGIPINFNATATGGTAPYQFKWWIQSGGVWTTARDWDTSASLTWQPSTAGTYYVAVWARNAGVTADASQAMMQVAYTINPATPLSITSLTSSVASPQTVGTSINFNATASGGTSPYQFKWWIQTDGVWRVARDWSASPSLTWQPTTPGTYNVAVWARNAGVTVDASQALGQVAYVITTSNPLSMTSFTSSVASPQAADTTINFTAVAAGGTAPYQFKWWIKNATSWTVAQDWSSTATLSWRPMVAGTYMVAVWARSAGVTDDASQAMAQVSYSITPATPLPPLVMSLSSSVQSPQVPGSTITFSAGATGGRAPYQFKWWIHDGSQWTVARDWGTGQTLSWQPTRTGTYMVAAWVRNSGVTADASQSLAQTTYVIAWPTEVRPSITSFTSSAASPTVAGTTVTFNTSASGGVGAYQFKWWIYSGGEWSVAQNWSDSSSFAWRPTIAGNYMVAVWVRNVGVTADASQALAQVNYTITQP